MTIATFIKQLEGYYGDYRPTVRAVVLQWLQSRKPTEHELAGLFAELVTEYTSQYRTPPDVAIMRPLLRRIQEESDHNRIADLTRTMLPDASEVVDRETQEAFWEAVNRAVSEGRDPSADEDISAILDQLGVLHQVRE